jgi:hypothetical protein
LGAALQFVAERRTRSFPQRVVGRGKVDQIRIVRDDDRDLALRDPRAE